MNASTSLTTGQFDFTNPGDFKLFLDWCEEYLGSDWAWVIHMAQMNISSKINPKTGLVYGDVGSCNLVYLMVERERWEQLEGAAAMRSSVSV